jgi:hypothetical protein
MDLEKYTTEPPATLKEAKDAYNEWFELMCQHTFEKKFLMPDDEAMMYRIEPTLNTSIELLKEGKKGRIVIPYTKEKRVYKVFKCTKCPKQKVSPNEQNGSLCKCGGVFRPHVTKIKGNNQ